MQTTFWKFKVYKFLEITNTRMFLLNLGLQIYLAQFFTDQRRPTEHLANIMYGKTPCVMYIPCILTIP